MKATEFLRNKKIVGEDKSDLIIGFSNGTKQSLILLLEEYHQAKLKLLGIADKIVQCKNCGDKVEMISSGEICPHCLC